MIDFVDAYMRDSNAFEEPEFDEQKILLKSVSKSLSKIIENELTPRQKICLKLFYVQGKTQSQIARDLKLSQPTVCRHIKTAKNIINKFLFYCFYSVKSANEQWLKM